MRQRILDTSFKTKLNINFISKKKFNSILNNSNYQVVEINWDHQYRKNHILFSTHFTATNFQYQYAKKLDITKKIILFGEWRKLTRFYRILDFNSYKVYLVK
ncbi:MAG: hypothetical protein LBT17_00155 [Mycoplasmataceae bacterium]|jgi:hypothetical protein|nr:hypothetical protein [Mycoplasmataceae bacterium]